ncbi:MAG: NAD(P)/FAD-dependent oxidoreductase [Bacteroidetes bacterium]|nr:NAD(P)/FAD-dependent oxidoreductase [Bacteroidota bacterium]
MLIDIPDKRKARIVIIGGGFGGIHLAKKISDKNIQVIILDRNNYHTFQPLLYQVATSALEAESIAYPIRKIFHRNRNVFFRLGEVKEVVPSEKKVLIDNDHLFYDYLVIATGAKTNYFGIEGLTISSMPMKSINEALDLRTMILQNFEKILMISNERKKQGYMNFVIAGGGPTGVELAGALGEMKQNLFPKDYPELDLSKMNIFLVHSGDRLLQMFSPASSERAKRYLENLGVTMVLNTRVLDIQGDYVQTSTGKDLIARTLIWTAGVTGNPVSGIEQCVNKSGRIKVDEFNRVTGLENIFAIGDVSCMESELYPGGHPQVATVAIQQGERLAKNLMRLLNRKPLKPFRYFNKGSMATIGKNKAVIELAGLKAGGSVAWLIWVFVHLMSLVGFRNKAITLFNWIRYYFSSDHGLRLIITPFNLLEEKRKRRKELEKT